MKKYIPIAILLIGILILGAVFFVTKNRKTDGDMEPDEEEALIDVLLNDRPFTRLVPSEDGHWLTLQISGFEIDAATLDYLLLYRLPDGRTQGVPGTIDLDNEKDIERELLLGSESSGKFRYDEGVENGTITLKFRNSKGQVVAKFESDFHLQTYDTSLSSVDGKFEYVLEDREKEVFFVTMNTFGLPGDFENDVSEGPYGVFSSGDGTYDGRVNLDGNIFLWDKSKWLNLEEGDSPNTGVFVSS